MRINNLLCSPVMHGDSRVCNKVIHGSPGMDCVHKLAVVFFLVYWSSQVPEAQGQGKLMQYRYVYRSIVLATVHSLRLVSRLQF